MNRIVNDTTALTAGSTRTNWTDEELLLEYRHAGIREAFEELVHRYERELYNYLYCYLGNAATAEDIFQKTFLAVLEKCDSFDANRVFRSWLYTIAVNKATDYLRKTKRFSQASIDSGSPGNGRFAEDLAQNIPGNEPAPIEESMNREIASKVREAVAALPERMREAVSMVYFQGLTYREAAQTIGIHYNTIVRRLKNAHVKLNFLLKNVG